ncbi:MAG TPA: SufS family cysteine desulfurase [Patescibacteria group bacterium]|nr:SufS family cysteine desulfurase [Patescibacteria group bacterium]
MKNLKKDFPIFKTYPELVYLDNSATSQKSQSVIEAVDTFYKNYNANIHRGIYDLSQTATDMFENVRKKVAHFINADSEKEIVFTASTTESINLVATGWAKKFLKKGDVVVLSEMEHHSNIIPWQRLRDEIGITLFFLPLTDDYRLDYQKFSGDFSKVKLLALTHVSNVLGTINPIEEIVAYFRENGSGVKVLLDIAQSIPHLSIDVKKFTCDFAAFSSHKMLGPSGVGVLYAKKEILEQMDPLLVGSHMIGRVTKEKVTYADIPERFESGTRNIEGVIGLGTAIDYLQQTGMKEIEKYEKEVTEYALEKFASVGKIKLFGPKISHNRIGVFSFAVGTVHAHDTAEILNRFHIAVRSGHHCAQVLMECLGISGTTRASIYLYNTKEDIDALIKGIEEVKDTFKQ